MEFDVSLTSLVEYYVRGQKYNRIGIFGTAEAESLEAAYHLLLEILWILGK